MLAMPALGQDAAEDTDVNVTDYGQVDIAVQDSELAQVLQMLSIQSQKNIITSKNVSGTVTANLYDVTFYEALDAILRANGYGYIEEHNFIYIYTQAEIEEIEKAMRQKEARIFEVNHLSAADAAELIAPLLSEEGKASFRGDVAPGMKPDISDAGANEYAFSTRIVVNDYPENLDAVAELVAELDVAPQQVLVEATILQTTLDEANAWGVDFSYLGDIDFTDLTDPLSAVDNLLAGANPVRGFQPEDNKAKSVQSTVGNTAGPGGLKFGILNDDLSLFVRVLDEVSDTTVLARPKLMCLNRQRAEVLVGARVGYLSTTATETTTTQTVEFLDTGIHLIFRPFISEDGTIRLELSPSVSEASLRDVTDSNGLVVTIPDELTNELTTNVRIHDGETLVLGGLFRESTKVTRRQVPLLGDLPIAGNLFRGQDDTVDRDEIMFLITPSIVPDDVLWSIGEESLGLVRSAKIGARKDLLEFSNSRLTDSYNQKALEAYNAGDLAKARWHVDNSLRLLGAQPEMVRFREMITQESEYYHERSPMGRVFREALGDDDPLSRLQTHIPVDTDHYDLTPDLPAPPEAIVEVFEEPHVKADPVPDFSDEPMGEVSVNDPELAAATTDEIDATVETIEPVEPISEEEMAAATVSTYSHLVEDEADETDEIDTETEATEFIENAVVEVEFDGTNGSFPEGQSTFNGQPVLEGEPTSEAESFDPESMNDPFTMESPDAFVNADETTESTFEDTTVDETTENAETLVSVPSSAPSFLRNFMFITGAFENGISSEGSVEFVNVPTDNDMND